MKRNKIVLGIGITAAVLALSVAAFAAIHVALVPNNATLNHDPNNGPTTMTFDAFCNATPCNISWVVILSNANVGSIDRQSGPQTTFNAGSSPGTAYIFASDGNGHMAQAKVDVQ